MSMEICLAAENPSLNVPQEEPFGDISFAEVDNYIALCRFRQSLVVLYAPVVRFTTALDARRVDAAFTCFDIVRYDRGGASQPAVHSVAY